MGYICKLAGLETGGAGSWGPGINELIIDQLRSTNHVNRCSRHIGAKNYYFF